MRSWRETGQETNFDRFYDSLIWCRPPPLPSLSLQNLSAPFLLSLLSLLVLDGLIWIGGKWRQDPESPFGQEGRGFESACFKSASSSRSFQAQKEMGFLTIPICCAKSYHACGYWTQIPAVSNILLVLVHLYLMSHKSFGEVAWLLWQPWGVWGSSLSFCADHGLHHSVSRLFNQLMGM